MRPSHNISHTSCTHFSRSVHARPMHTGIQAPSRTCLASLAHGRTSTSIPKGQRLEDIRFCRQCWTEQPSLDDLKGVVKPTVQYVGCITQSSSSTAALINHIRASHEHLLPGHVSAERSSSAKGGSRPD